MPLKNLTESIMCHISTNNIMIHVIYIIKINDISTHKVYYVLLLFKLYGAICHNPKPHGSKVHLFLFFKEKYT